MLVFNNELVEGYRVMMCGLKFPPPESTSCFPEEEEQIGVARGSHTPLVRGQ